MFMESTCRSRILFYIVDLRDFCPRIQSETNKFYYLDVAEWGRYPAIAPKVLRSSLTLKIFVLCETPVSKVANQAPFSVPPRRRGPVWVEKRMQVVETHVLPGKKV